MAKSKPFFFRNSCGIVYSPGRKYPVWILGVGALVAVDGVPFKLVAVNHEHAVLQAATGVNVVVDHALRVERLSEAGSG